MRVIEHSPAYYKEFYERLFAHLKNGEADATAALQTLVDMKVEISPNTLGGGEYRVKTIVCK